VFAKIPGIEYAFSVDSFAETERLDKQLAMLPNDTTVAAIGASFTGLEVATEMCGRLGDHVRIILVDQASRADSCFGAGPSALCGRSTRRVSYRNAVRQDGFGSSLRRPRS